MHTHQLSPDPSTVRDPSRTLCPSAVLGPSQNCAGGTKSMLLNRYRAIAVIVLDCGMRSFSH